MADDHQRSGVRITFVTDIITPYMVDVFEALARLCDLTVLFCSASGTRAMPWEFGDGFGFDHRVVGGLTVRRDHPDATDYYLSPRIIAAVARSRPDAVICAGYSIPTLYGSVYCTLRRRPLLIHSDGTSSSERALNRLQGVARGVLLPRVAGAVANSGPAADRFRELGVPDERLFMAPHATRLEPMWEVAAARTYAVVGPLRVAVVGRLIERKGIDRLLRAVPNAVERGADVCIDLVGTGPAESELRSLATELGIAESVNFGGFAGSEELPKRYRDADAFAFPTLEDPFGFVLLEAMAAGLPVLSSPRAGATTELVVDGENGLVVDPDDADRMVDALVRLASDEALRARIGQAAHTATLGRTPEATAEGYLHAVTQVLGR